MALRAGYVERQVGADGEVTDSARWPAVEAAFGEVWAEMPEGRSQGLEADEALQEASALPFSLCWSPGYTTVHNQLLAL